MVNGEIMQNNIIENKSFAFAVRIVNVYKHLCSQSKEFVIAKQLLRAGTSIGANVAEAIHGQSKADFTSKMAIALKEANETSYWLKLLKETDYLTASQFKSLHNDCTELLKLLIAICKTSTQK